MRLLTRPDFDGLACAAMLKSLGIIRTWKFIDIKEMQDGLVKVTQNDVIANIPYVKGCKLWFDHHSSEMERLGSDLEFEGASYHAPSAARIIYEYYGGAEKLSAFTEMVEAADKVDAGRLTADEIMDPSGWVLLGFLIDPRTGLSRFRNFSISAYALIELLIDACSVYTIDEILQLPDVQERIKVYWEQNNLFKDMLLTHSRIDWEIIITDLRGVDPVYTGNRFLVYSLFPDQNISVFLTDIPAKKQCAFAVGYSVLNRTATINVGSLMLQYGGGGHRQVGACRVPSEEADRVLLELIKKMHAMQEAELLNTNSTQSLADILPDLDALELLLAEIGIQD